MVDQDEGQLVRARVFRIDDWVVDPNAGTITRADIRETLEPKVMELLVFLAERPDETITIDELMDNVWAGVVVTESSVYWSVSRLRKALGDDSRSPRFIATVPKKGYRFVGQVSDTPAEAATVSPTPRNIRYLAGGVTLTALIAGLLGWYAWQAGTTSPPSLAVLPFVTQAHDDDTALLARGISEELIDVLGSSAELRIIARASSFRFAGADAALPEIGAALGVSNVLAGRLDARGDELVLQAVLIDATRGTEVWTRDLVRSRDDLLEMPLDLARTVARTMAPDFAVGAGRHSSDLAAYNLYLLGRNEADKRTPNALDVAEDYFRAALELDPNYALAWAGMARVEYLRISYATDRNVGMFAEVERLAAKALQLAPDSPEALAMLARHANMVGDYSAAGQYVDRALALRPNMADAWFSRAQLMNRLERYPEAMQGIEHALARDPMSMIYRRNLAGFLQQRARIDESRTEFQRLIELNPTSPNGYHGMASTYLATGDLEQALGWLQRAVRVDARGFESRGALQSLYMNLGMLQQAEAAFPQNSTVVALARGDYVEAVRAARARVQDWDAPSSHNMLASTLVLAGDLDEARREFEWLRNPNHLGGGQFFYRFHALGFAPAYYAHVLKVHGESADNVLDDAHAYFERAFSGGLNTPALHYWYAAICHLQGRTPRALDHLQQALEAGYVHWITPVNPVFAGLANDPDYRRLVYEHEARRTALRTRILSSQAAAD